MKIYIAASFPRKDVAESLAVALRESGFEVVSRWHSDDGNSVYGKRDLADMRAKAQRDMDGVRECDALIMFTGDELTHGGRHSEFGMALALGKMTAIIGPVESVFQSLCPLVYEDIAGFLYDATDLWNK